MRGSEIDAVRGVAVDELMIGCVGRTVSWTVHVRVIVTAARRSPQVMIGAQRAVQHERKRRHDRQDGRETPAQQLDETNHPRTGITLHLARF